MKKYSLLNNNKNIKNIRNRDKSNDSIGQRLVRRRKGSSDSIELKNNKKKKYSK